jgi:hypothetical protein
MSKIQHKLFRIKITNGTIYRNLKVFDEINKFLENSNYVYVNHAITTIFENNLVNTSENIGYVPQNLQYNQVHKYEIQATFIVISLVYKDLIDYGEDVNSLSEKTQSIIKSGVLDNKKIEKPNFKTEIDIENK